MNDFGHDGVWCCERKHKCNFQGFTLDKGLSWGIVPVNTEWRRYHDKCCGGRLIQLIEPTQRVMR